MPLFNTNISQSIYVDEVLIPNAKVHIINTTSIADNPKTLDISSLGLSVIHSVKLTAWKNTSVIGSIPLTANILNATTSTITYGVVESNNTEVSILGVNVEGLKLSIATDINLRFEIIGT